MNKKEDCSVATSCFLDRFVCFLGVIIFLSKMVSLFISWVQNVLMGTSIRSIESNSRCVYPARKRNPLESTEIFTLQTPKKRFKTFRKPVQKKMNKKKETRNVLSTFCGLNLSRGRSKTLNSKSRSLASVWRGRKGPGDPVWCMCYTGCLEFWIFGNVFFFLDLCELWCFHFWVVFLW